MNHVARRLSLPLLAALLLVAVAGIWWSRQDSSATAERPVYAALGASDAVGIGADRPATDGWVPRVHAGLPPGTELLNLGINGATLGDVVRQALPVAVDARPRWVSIWPGVNDLRDGVSLDAFSAELDRLLATLGRLPGVTVVVLTIPDLRLLPAFAGDDPPALDQEVRDWNAVIAATAARHRALLVDLYADAPEMAAHPDYLSEDGFHPSSVGYRRIADLVLRTLDGKGHATPATP